MHPKERTCGFPECGTSHDCGWNTAKNIEKVRDVHLCRRGR